MVECYLEIMKSSAPTSKKKARSRTVFGAKGSGKILHAKAIRAGQKHRNAGDGDTAITIDLAAGTSFAKPRVLRFGAVTVSNTAPDVDTLVCNVKAGRDALGRVRDALVKPGVTLGHKSEVPKFRVDAKDPTTLIREVNGRIDRGHIVGGTFVPAE